MSCVCCCMGQQVLTVLLQELLVAANSATEDQSFETSVEMLLAVRPELDIAWTTRNGPPGPAVQPDEVDR